MEPIDLEQIIQKSYDSLSAAELEVIQDICPTEDEFNQLKQVFQSIKDYKDERIEAATPRLEVKSKLDELFYQTHQRKPLLWYNSVWMTLYPKGKRLDQRPLVRIAAVLLLVLSVVPLLDQPQDSKETKLASKQPMEKKIEKLDTVIETPAIQSTQAVKESTNQTPLISTIQLASSVVQPNVIQAEKYGNVKFMDSEEMLFSATPDVLIAKKTETVEMFVDGFIRPTTASVKSVQKDQQSNDNSSGFNPLLLDVLTATY